MTTITTTCEGCGRQLTVPERYQGRDLKCPSCGRPFRAEAARPEPQPATPDAPAAVPPVAPPVVPPVTTPSFDASPFEEPPAPAPLPPPTQPEPPEPAAAPDATGGAAAVYWRVKRIEVLSLALLSALLHGVLGLLVGVAVAIASLTPAAQALPFPHGPLVALLAVLLLPLVYAAIGFLAGALSAVVYNLGARLTGGVSLLLE